MSLAVKMMRTLRSEGISGYHLCTLNLEKSVTRVLNQLEWVTPESVAAVKRARVRSPVITFSNNELTIA